MGKIVHVTLENFRDQVMEPSMVRAVVIDFWSATNPHSINLSSSLEQLSVELDFVLAKVDVNTNTDLINHFQIENIPDVKIVLEGQLVDGFSGDKPISKIREILKKHLISPLDKAMQDIEALVLEGHTAKVIEPLNQLVQQFPKEKKIQYWLAKALINENRNEDAEALLNTFQEGDVFYTQAKAILNLKVFAQDIDLEVKSDLDGFYVNGCKEALKENHEAALRSFLEIVKKDRSYKDDIGRTSMLTLFGILGNKDPLTLKFRQMLSMYLFS